MKVYVDKNNVDVLDDLFDATNSYECWACNRDDNLEIVSLADYTKQVREEVVEEIKEKFNKKVLYVKIDGLYSYVEAIKFDDVNKILDQVKGEGNVKD